MESDVRPKRGETAHGPVLGWGGRRPGPGSRHQNGLDGKQRVSDRNTVRPREMLDARGFHLDRAGPMWEENLENESCCRQAGPTSDAGERAQTRYRLLYRDA